MVTTFDESPTYGSELNYLFTEVINDSGLEQLVTQQLETIIY